MQNELTRGTPFAVNAALILSVVLWLVSVVLAMLCLFAARELLILGLGLLFTGADRLTQMRGANLLNTSHHCLIMILAVVDVTVLMAITEYFFRYMGQPRLLRAQLVIIALECAMVVPAWWMFWRYN
jgi:hypothetical protein